MDHDDLTTVAALEPRHVAQLMALYAEEWWTHQRELEDVRVMLAATPIVVGVVARATDELIGFARVVTDRVYYAVLLDVIVRADHRGRGIGALLLDTVLAHPQLERAMTITLKCRDDKVAFYERWGFAVSGALPMVEGQPTGSEMRLRLRD